MVEKLRLTLMQIRSDIAVLWKNDWGSPVSAHSAAILRICLGAVLSFWAVHYLWSGRAHLLCSSEVMHFTWPGLSRVGPPGEIGVTLLFGLIAVSGVLLACGAVARVAAGLAAAAFTWFFLIDQTSYQNHYVLLLLLCWACVFVPVNRVWSFDAEEQRLQPVMPAAGLWLLQFHVALPYVFGGLSKLDPEWLSGQPMRLLLSDRFGLPADNWQTVQGGLLLAWGGMAFDLLIVPALVYRATRPIAVPALVIFHVTNAVLFPIHIFPWFMLAASTIFFPPDWPARLLCRRSDNPPADFVPGSLTAVVQPPQTPDFSRSLQMLVACWCLLQLLLPLRHLAIPGDASWTEQGHFFAWRMMLRGKTGEVHFLATRPADGYSWLADHSRLLHQEQLARFSIDPEMIRQVAATIARLHRERTGEQIEVRALALASLNGRPPALLIDPGVDLAAEPEFALRRAWILPKPPASDLLWRHPPGDWVRRISLPDRWQKILHREDEPATTGLTQVNKISD